ncbi:DUF397 domain-containing protein [Actinomadura rupiterrae]|uniref:DUF397 domain-containing protein n=1 Tax=Actinomadura rupiterrae TaxID=559627 RepID=UPI0020A3199E|nr:DUF397 domain-containing protein [Actinomadura rupiterrae]
MSEISEEAWRKSSRSHEEGDQCVELTRTNEGVAFRDSKEPDGWRLCLVRDAFRLLVGLVKDAEARA